MNLAFKESMAFDLHISLPDDSPIVDVVQRFAAAEHISPDQAAARLLGEATRLHDRNTPAEELMGAFSSPEDAAILERAMASAKAHRAQFDQLRDLSV